LNLEALFPLFRDAWILHDDGDVIVVDKPSCMSTHETEPGDTDHAVARLAAHLRARGQRDYLGIHQRLDKDTSGVLLFSRNPARNKALAAEFEGRRVEKAYVAGVVLPRGAPPKGTLRGFLVKEKGVMGVYAKKPVRAPSQEAITHYRVLDRRGDRALLAVKPETGRTHQIRVQLAHAGMPVAGDTLYGGPPCSRLLLHAERLALAHPATGRKFDISSNPPDVFARWLQGTDAVLPDSAADIERRLRVAADKRAAIARETAPDGERQTTAFRICNGAGDDLPGVQVDLHDRHLVVSLVSPEAETRQNAILDAAAALGADGVYLKVRPKQASVLKET